jgi:hypothetical protein
MSAKLGALAMAACVLAGISSVAMAQAPYGRYPYVFTPGYVSGWGAPPASLPYPACSTMPDFGNSTACEVPGGVLYGAGSPYGAHFYPPYWR